MTALAADKKLEYTEGVEVPVPVDDGDKIYAGAFVCVNAAGYAVPGSDTAGLIFQGVAMEQKDNTLGADGALDVTVRRRGLVKAIMGTAITQANIGDNVFLVDDQTVDLTANVTNNISCGKIVGYIDTTHAWIDIEAPAAAAADADVSQADAATQTASYVQADVQTVAALANALKTDLNDLKAKLRAAGILAS